jgi:sulfite exporter TauE/SafE
MLLFEIEFWNLEYASALLLGLVGSLHCAGMCGPIAVALPLNNRSWFSRISGGLLYNAGRTVTYGLMGIVLGLAGMGIALGGMQQWVSVAVGAIMVLSVLVPRLGKFGNRIIQVTDSMTSHFKKPLIKLFKQRTYSSLLLIGLLNGFLPCGLVYIALAGALLMSKPHEGFLYMIFFGIGTIPMLLVISLAGNLLSQKVRLQLSRIIPLFIVLLGILFILRGLNLGIPYVSPKLSQQGETAKMECCSPKK